MQMELASASSHFFEELFAAPQVNHLFKLIDFDNLKQSEARYRFAGLATQNHLSAKMTIEAIKEAKDNDGNGSSS